MITTVRIVHDITENTKPVRGHQTLVFCWIKAAMIKRLSTVRARGLPVCWSAGEHEWSTVRSVRRKPRKHVALIAWTKVKETVPRQNTVEAATDFKLAHISDE